MSTSPSTSAGGRGSAPGWQRGAIGALIAVCALAAGCRDRDATGNQTRSEAETAPRSEAETKAETGTEAGNAPVSRLITLTPSATELVAAVGAADRLVGVDSFSSHPPLVRDLPRVGDFLRPSFEAIVALAPDLVIADQVQAEVARGLEDAGIRTLLLSMHTLDDVRTGLSRVGRALDREAAARAAVAAMDRAVVQARARASGRGRPRVLAVVDRQVGGLGNLVAAGPGSYIDELLSIAGADNALSGYRVRYPKLSAEQILRARPELILDLAPSADPETARRDWSRLPELPAVQRDRVHVLQDGVYLAPGPRVAQALERLSRLLHDPTAPVPDPARAPATAPAAPDAP